MALGALTWLIVALGAGPLRWLGVLLFTTCSLLVALAGIRDFAGRRVRIGGRDCGVCESASVHLYSASSSLSNSPYLHCSSLKLADHVNVVFELLNRNQDLTGRTEIWSIVMDAILKHPYSVGYHAFGGAPTARLWMFVCQVGYLHTHTTDSGSGTGFWNSRAFAVRVSARWALAFDASGNRSNEQSARTVSLGLSDFHTIVKPDRGRT